jgi:predicted transcriptional regulator
MNIEARKISLAQKIFAIQQEMILDKIEALLNQESSSPLSKEQKKAIDIGLKSLEEGDKIPHEQVMNETKKRYPNLF